MPTLVHLGLGAFARAHLCDYTQDAGGWYVVGVGLLPADAVVRDAHPEHGYDLLLGPVTRRVEVVSAYLYDDPAAVLSALADAAICSLRRRSRSCSCDVCCCSEAYWSCSLATWPSSSERRSRAARARSSRPCTRASCACAPSRA